MAIGAASVCARNALITVVSCDVARVALKTEEGKKRKKEEKVERIYAGDFALAGCRRCDVYCPLHDICRVQLVNGDGGQGGESDE